MKFHQRSSLAFLGTFTAPRWIAVRQLARGIPMPPPHPQRGLSIVYPAPTFFSAGIQLQSRGIHFNASFLDDDDFVDIDAPAGGLSGTRVEQSNATSADAAANVNIAATSKACAPEGEESILGLVCVPEEAPGTERSRFHIPLETPREGKAIPRYNSRSAQQLSEDSHPVNEEAEVRHDQSMQSSGAKDEERESAPQGLEAPSTPKGLSVPPDSTAIDRDGAHHSHTHDCMPDPSSLPYDDEAFAEMLLQMEVDGAIDEAWQDARKAHVEDVKELCEVLRSLKVRDICCIDVSDKTASFDYILYGTCEGPRHIHIASWAAQEADSLHRVSKVSRKKTDELWEVVPIGRIVLNLMVDSLREELSLERKWAVTRTMDPLSAANAPVSEGRYAKAHGLWTLTLNLQDLEDFEVDYCKDVLLRQA